MFHTTFRWRGHAATFILTLLGFLALTALMAGPWINFDHLDTAIYPGDPSLVAWVLAWDSHALLTGTPFYSANVYYPAPNSLFYIEHHLGLAVFALPIYALTRNPVLTYNVLFFAAFLLNALACYALARHLSLPRLASAIGATIYAFSSFRMLHQGHLQLQWSLWFPLVIIALRVWFRDGRLLALALVLVCVVLQMLVTGYMAVMMVLVVGLYSVWTMDWSLARLRRLGAVAVVGAIAAGIVWIAFAPYRQLASPDMREALMYSATFSDYALPMLNSVAGQALSWCCYVRGGDIFGEHTLYLGLAAIALTIVGIADAVSRKARTTTLASSTAPRDVIWFFVALSLIAFALSFGPSPADGGWRPFDLASKLGPVALFRVPARFALLVIFAMSILAAYGAARIATRYGRTGQVVLLALFALMIAEYRPLNPSIGKPQPADTPRLYKLLARMPPGALVNLPAFRETPMWWREADYMLYSTRDWRPIVNGYGRSEPEDYDWIVGHMRAFPGENSAKTMRRIGVRYVMLFTDRFADQKEAATILEELRASPDFTLVAQDGPVLLLTVNENGPRQ